MLYLEFWPVSAQSIEQCWSKRSLTRLVANDTVQPQTAILLVGGRKRSKSAYQDP
jgi:hypothetical protein